MVSSPTPREAAKEAGLSTHQPRIAIRVANIRRGLVALVESEKPPTITELAEHGKKLQALQFVGQSRGNDSPKVAKLLGVATFGKFGNLRGHAGEWA